MLMNKKKKTAERVEGSSWGDVIVIIKALEAPTTREQAHIVVQLWIIFGAGTYVHLGAYSKPVTLRFIRIRPVTAAQTENYEGLRDIREISVKDLFVIFDDWIDKFFNVSE